MNTVWKTCFMLAAAVAVVFFVLQGCSWQKAAKTTLVSSEAALATVNRVGLDYYQRTCRAIATECPAGTTQVTCKPLGACWHQRRVLQAALDKVALSIATAWTVLVAADLDTWKARLTEIIVGMRYVDKILAAIMPRGEV